jgi:hypothetical protein
VRNKGHSTSNEIGRGKSDTNEGGERIEIGTVTGIVIETVTAIAPRHIGLIVDCPHVVGIRNERNPPHLKTQLLHQYSLPWMKSHWKRLHYKCY